MMWRTRLRSFIEIGAWERCLGEGEGGGEEEVCSRSQNRILRTVTKFDPN